MLNNIKDVVMNVFSNAVTENKLLKKDFEWLQDVMQRRTDTHEYIFDLALKFEGLAQYKDNTDIFKLNLYKVHKELEKLKVFFFKQRLILLAVPQRKKHPNFPAPNLGGLVIPQNYRIKGEVCYGMAHAEARNYLVFKALENPDITDILFIDDDILLPLDAITRLADSNELIVSANYIKKQFPVESCALTIKDGLYYYHNREVLPTQNDMQPVPVSQCGMGACLISVDMFKKIEQPWFEFVYNKDGSVYAGEDVRFCQKAIIKGITPKVIPGLVPVHVDFKTGKHFGPEWLIKDGFLRKEYINQYCHFQCDPKDCDFPNIK